MATIQDLKSHPGFPGVLSDVLSAFDARLQALEGFAEAHKPMLTELKAEFEKVKAAAVAGVDAAEASLQPPAPEPPVPQS